MLLNSVTDITNPFALFAMFQTNIKRLFSNFEQALHLGADLSASESICRITHIAVELNHTIKRDIVTLLKKNIFRRNTVNNNIVHRYAESCGETLEAFAQRDATIVADILLSDLVEESSGDTGTNEATHLRESFPEEASAVTY